MFNRILYFVCLFGINSMPAYAATEQTQDLMMAIQEARIHSLEQQLTDLTTALNSYLKKTDAASTYITKADADKIYATPAQVLNTVKGCRMRLGYSKNDKTTPATVGLYNTADTGEWTSISLPSNPLANDKIYYDINCAPWIIIWPPVILNPGTLDLSKK